MSAADDPAPVSTRRLTLRVPDRGDVDEVFGMYAHPEVWSPDPLSRQTDPAQTRRMIDAWRVSWERDGLGMWVARSSHPDDHADLVGVGGCFVRADVAWNLGFRLLPRYWGRGLAQEICAAAFGSAARLHPDLPVTAAVLEGNVRSQAATERAGLHVVWRGPDAGNPDVHAVRVLYADRAASAATVEILTAT